MGEPLGYCKERILQYVVLTLNVLNCLRRNGNTLRLRM